MIKMNEEVYLQNLVFKKAYDDKGLVKGEIVFKNRMSLKEYTNIQYKKDLILCDKLQNNRNELKRWLEEEMKSDLDEYQKRVILYVYNKMQELEQGK